MSDTPQSLLENIDESLHILLGNYWSDWTSSCETRQFDLPGSFPLVQLGYSWACSDYIARTCIRYPHQFYALYEEGFEKPRLYQDYQLLISSVLEQHQDEAQLMSALRELRNLEMLRIAWRDLHQQADIKTILQELTDFAELVVALSLESIEDQLAELHGMPLDAQGEPQRLLTFAMGKMGGGELNFSSDIDLVFSFVDDGETSGPRKKSHYEFYLAAIRKLVKLLDEVTVDGFVYRVDTRLRPFGDSGPMAMSYSGMEQYYQMQGRDWERYAMIKAKLITGREHDRAALQALLTPFVFRRYLDFSMIESIREMKSMINAQMKRKGMMNNIKLGHGGIREIEFITQTLQLIRAGREPELRERSVIKVLTLLGEKHYLQPAEVEQLINAYWFLRKLENRLQMLGDKQTHSLPDDELSQQRICTAMNMENWPLLLEALASHQVIVDTIFQNLITTEDEAPAKEVSAFTQFWTHVHIEGDIESENLDELKQYLATTGYNDVDSITRQLFHLHASPQIRSLDGDMARLMSQLMDSLVVEIADYPQQVDLLDRVSRIIKALAGRKVYISLLNEFPAIQIQMLTLCATSEWFTVQLTRYPILLDTLLSSAEVFRHEYDIKQLLKLELKRIEVDETNTDPDSLLEPQMERMRQFKRQTVFNVAMLDVFYEEPVEIVSDRLTDLANALLERILDYSWQTMVGKYGEPRCVINGDMFRPTMAILAYGKMGGNELGYGSDLDIIFVHNSSGDKQHTDGEKCVDNQRFFARVAQRVIHFLNTRVYSGLLYEADTRLRPDGSAGLMVTSIVAFESYQREKAWTWEHQALIRARFVTGSALIEQEFDRIRSSVLQQPRQRDDLLAEVVKMREKMRQHLANKSGGFDIKQDNGGLVDIEFVTQAGVLLFAGKCDDCIRHTATLELINVLVQAGWYTRQDADQLSAAYRLFRKLKNWQNLQCDTGSISTDQIIEQHRDNVRSVWKKLMPLPATGGH